MLEWDAYIQGLVHVGDHMTQQDYHLLWSWSVESCWVTTKESYNAIVSSLGMSMVVQNFMEMAHQVEVEMFLMVDARKENSHMG